MTLNNIFKIKELDNIVNSLEVKVQDYLAEKNYYIKDRKLKRLIEWNHTVINQKIVKVVYPNEDCPNDIKKIVKEFIVNEFNTSSL
ncbi:MULTISPECIES: hypothetical protein [Tenacibaculum]|nr:hypothetical protein [Tenacibaculum sp. E3R01]RBW56546.1 hypothetical protein DS884_13850 [Tenacibaculum sp. E3R01]